MGRAQEGVRAFILAEASGGQMLALAEHLRSIPR